MQIAKKKKKSKYYVYAFKLTQSADLTKDRDAQEIFCAKLLQRKRDKEVWKVPSKAGSLFSTKAVLGQVQVKSSRISALTVTTLDVPGCFVQLVP